MKVKFDFKHLNNLYYLLKCMNFAIKYEKIKLQLVTVIDTVSI